MATGCWIIDQSGTGFRKWRIATSFTKSRQKATGLSISKRFSFTLLHFSKNQFILDLKKNYNSIKMVNQLMNLTKWCKQKVRLVNSCGLDRHLVSWWWTNQSLTRSFDRDCVITVWRHCACCRIIRSSRCSASALWFWRSSSTLATKTRLRNALERRAKHSGRSPHSSINQSILLTIAIKHHWFNQTIWEIENSSIN